MRISHQRHAITSREFNALGAFGECGKSTGIARRCLVPPHAVDEALVLARRPVGGDRVVTLAPDGSRSARFGRAHLMDATLRVIVADCHR